MGRQSIVGLFHDTMVIACLLNFYHANFLQELSFRDDHFHTDSWEVGYMTLTLYYAVYYSALYTLVAGL